MIGFTQNGYKTIRKNDGNQRKFKSFLSFNVNVKFNLPASILLVLDDYLEGLFIFSEKVV